MRSFEPRKPCCGGVHGSTLAQTIHLSLLGFLGLSHMSHAFSLNLMKRYRRGLIALRIYGFGKKAWLAWLTWLRSMKSITYVSQVGARPWLTVAHAVAHRSCLLTRPAEGVCYV